MIKINRHGQMRGKPWRRIILLALLLSFALLTSCSKPLEKLSAAELLNLGEKYLLEQDYKQAVVHFERLIEIEPKSSRGYIGLAKAYAGLEQTEDAIAALQRGLEALPDDPDILAMLEELGAVSPEPAEEPPEAPAEPAGMPAEPAETPAEPAPWGENENPALWDESEWVFNGVRVTDGGVDALAQAIDASLVSEHQYAGRPAILFVKDIKLSYISGPASTVAGVYEKNLERFAFLYFFTEGTTGMRGITIGETGLDEVQAMFPLPDVEPSIIHDPDYSEIYAHPSENYIWYFDDWSYFQRYRLVFIGEQGTYMIAFQEEGGEWKAAAFYYYDFELYDWVNEFISVWLDSP